MMPESIVTLANCNKRIVATLVGKLDCSTADLWNNWDMCRQAGLLYMRDFFNQTRYEMFENNLLLAGPNPFITEEKFDLAEKLLKSGFTLIVLRPDMYHLSDVVSNFLHEQGYEIQSQFDTKISPDIYWHMYKIAIVHPDAADTMPTRTLVYTGSVAKVLVFREGRMKQNLDTTMCVADAFSTRYKGRQGIMTNNTLRGELVFGASVKLGLHLLGEPLIQMACDPLGAYRHKVAGNCYAKTAPQAHLSKEHQLLQYTGVGIHVPDSSELVNDICSLLTLKHLQALSA